MGEFVMVQKSQANLNGRVDFFRRGKLATVGLEIFEGIEAAYHIDHRRLFQGHSRHQSEMAHCDSNG